MLVPLPDEVSFEEGAVCADSGSTAYEALARLGLVGGQWLLVYGIGAIGAAATAIAAASGVRVIAAEPDPPRSSLATRLGAAFTISPDEAFQQTVLSITEGRGVDAALDTSVTDLSSVNCLNSLRVWGTYCLTGESTRGVSVDLVTPIKRELTIVGSWGAPIGSLSRLARRLVDRKIPLSMLITQRFQLADAAKAFELCESPATGKVLLTWPNLERNQLAPSESHTHDRPEPRSMRRANPATEIEDRRGAGFTHK
jgi:threonine dehydrogenase-like Zn-dependent dehydrogenase